MYDNYVRNDVAIRMTSLWTYSVTYLTQQNPQNLILLWSGANILHKTLKHIIINV